MNCNSSKIYFFMLVVFSIGLISSINYAFAETTFVDSFDVSGEDSAPSGLAFNTDGTKMFVSSTDNDNVYQYTLSTGFDASSATTTGVVTFDVSGQETGPEGIAFNTDGTKMFVIGQTGEKVNEYTCSSFDISTCSFVDSFDVSGQDASPRDLVFNTDGTKMFVIGTGNGNVYEYTLSVGFDIVVTVESDSECYDCIPPSLQSAIIRISTNEHIVTSESEPIHIEANVGDTINVTINVTDNLPVDTIPFAALYTNFAERPDDMNLFYANNFDDRKNYSTSFYEWNVKIDDVAYDHFGTISWEESVVTKSITDENTLVIPFTMTIQDYMESSQIFVKVRDGNGNQMHDSLPVSLEITKNAPFDFDAIKNKKILSFYNDSVLLAMLSQWSNSSGDMDDLSEMLNISEPLPEWTRTLGEWTAEEKIETGDLVVAIEYVINN